MCGILKLLSAGEYKSHARSSNIEQADCSLDMTSRAFYLPLPHVSGIAGILEGEREET